MPMHVGSVISHHPVCRRPTGRIINHRAGEHARYYRKELRSRHAALPTPLDGGPSVSAVVPFQLLAFSDSGEDGGRGYFFNRENPL